MSAPFYEVCHEYIVDPDALRSPDLTTVNYQSHSNQACDKKLELARVSVDW